MRRVEFREDNFSRAMGTLQEKMGEDPADPRSEKVEKANLKRAVTRKVSVEGYLTALHVIDDIRSSDISKISKWIMQKNYNPVIVFAFSKRECEALALTLSKFEFNSTDEQDLVSNIFTMQSRTWLQTTANSPK